MTLKTCIQIISRIFRSQINITILLVLKTTPKSPVDRPQPKLVAVGATQNRLLDQISDLAETGVSTPENLTEIFRRSL